MKLVRNSVFETNSSSCHSISVGQTDVFEGITPDEEGKIVIYPGEFGWGYDTHTDIGSRLSYLWIYIRDWTSDEKQAKFQDMFEEVVKEHSGATSVVMELDTSSNWNAGGYIDHQSAEDNQLDWLFDDKSTLKSFIFDSGSIIIVDNDNH